MAAWKQREHQRPLTSVLSQGGRPLRIQSSRPRCRGPQTQHAPEKNPWLPDTRRYPGHSRCADRLNPPLECSQGHAPGISTGLKDGMGDRALMSAWARELHELRALHEEL